LRQISGVCGGEIDIAVEQAPARPRSALFGDSRSRRTAWDSYEVFFSARDISWVVAELGFLRACGSHGLVRMEGDHVVFTWRDRADHDRVKEMSLPADEFLRRFLLHVLPDRFVRIRYYGLLANRNRQEDLI